MLDDGLFHCVRPYFIHLAQHVCPEVLPSAGDAMPQRDVFDGKFKADDQDVTRLDDGVAPLMDRALRLLDEALSEGRQDVGTSSSLSRLVAQLELAHLCLPSQVLLLARALLSAIVPLALQLADHCLLPLRTGHLWLRVHAHHPQPQNFGAQTVAVLAGRSQTYNWQHVHHHGCMQV